MSFPSHVIGAPATKTLLQMLDHLGPFCRFVQGAGRPGLLPTEGRSVAVRARESGHIRLRPLLRGRRANQLPEQRDLD